MIEISAILLAHGEGVIVGQSLRSMMEAVADAESAGISTEMIAVLDRPDDATLSLLDGRSDVPLRTHIVDFGDQGLARNAAVDLARGRFIAFLDGDDLWSYNWLTKAYECIADAPTTTIAHPEFNWFFEGSQNLFVHADPGGDDFDLEFLRVANYWDALCFCAKDVYRQKPFCKRDIRGGFALEDWHWNCRTFEAGLQHRIVPDTVHFKRRRDDSKNLEASRRKALVRPTALFSYDYYESAP